MALPTLQLNTKSQPNNIDSFQEMRVLITNWALNNEFYLLVEAIVGLHSTNGSPSDDSGQTHTAKFDLN